jgi:hypothetical protein
MIFRTVLLFLLFRLPLIFVYPVQLIWCAHFNFFLFQILFAIYVKGKVVQYILRRIVLVSNSNIFVITLLTFQKTGLVYICGILSEDRIPWCNSFQRLKICRNIMIVKHHTNI